MAGVIDAIAIVSRVECVVFCEILNARKNAMKLFCGPRNIFRIVGGEDQFIFGSISLKLPVNYLSSDGVKITLDNVYQATDCHAVQIPNI